MRKNLYRRLAMRWPIKNVSRKYHGHTVFLPRASYSDLALHAGGEFEAENCNVIVQLVRPKTMMLDIGTNFGLISIPVLTKCLDVNVLSFEPSENALKFLRRTMDASRFRNRWELIEKCAGAKVGTTEFTLSQQISSEFDGMRHTKRASSRRTCRVPVTTVDEEWRRRNCPEVSVIKCDVEGAEMEVLHGAVECINLARPYVVMEWNRVNIKAYDVTSADLMSFINKVAYDIYALPAMIRVASGAELDLQAIVTETLLLSPRVGSVSQRKL
jgi:FkbM family methyltransferase